MIRDARLRTEIIDDRGRIPRYGLFRHSLEEILQLSQVLALAWGSALNELLPRFGIGEAGVAYPFEDVVLGFNGYDGAVCTILEIFRLVLLG